MKRQSILTYVKERAKSAVALDVVFAVYLAFCFGSGIYLGVEGITGTCIRAFAFMLIVPVILLAEWLSGLRITPATCALLLFVPTGSLLGGAGYNLYTVIPFFDTILHGISGVVFTCIGFAVLKLFVGEPESTKSFLACLLFGFIFAAAIATLWELFEYTAHLVTGNDIEEDTLINGFQSYLLSGDHSNPVILEGIKETIVVLEDGTEYIISGGYLELGLIDTICDMAICCGGSVLISIIVVIDWFTDKKKYLYRFFIPEYISKKEKPESETPPQSEAPAQV